MKLSKIKTLVAVIIVCSMIFAPVSGVTVSKAKASNRSKVIKIAKGKLGCPYVWGARGPKSFDCSGFVYWVNKQAYKKGYTKKRVSSGCATSQLRALKRYSVSRSLSRAKPGDLIFFSNNRSTSNIRHVAIYYGNYKLIHASAGKVRVTGVGWSGGQRQVAAIVRVPGL